MIASGTHLGWPPGSEPSPAAPPLFPRTPQPRQRAVSLLTQPQRATHAMPRHRYEPLRGRRSARPATAVAVFMCRFAIRSGMLSEGINLPHAECKPTDTRTMHRLLMRDVTGNRCSATCALSCSADSLATSASCAAASSAACLAAARCALSSSSRSASAAFSASARSDCSNSTRSSHEKLYGCDAHRLHAVEHAVGLALAV